MAGDASRGGGGGWKRQPSTLETERRVWRCWEKGVFQAPKGELLGPDGPLPRGCDSPLVRRGREAAAVLGTLKEDPGPEPRRERRVLPPDVTLSFDVFVSSPGGARRLPLSLGSYPSWCLSSPPTHTHASLHVFPLGQHDQTNGDGCVRRQMTVRFLLVLPCTPGRILFTV